LSNGDWIIGFFNRENTPQVRSMDFLNQLGVSGQVMVRDLWQHSNLGKMSNISLTVPPHGCVVLKLTKILQNHVIAKQLLSQQFRIKMQTILHFLHQRHLPLVCL
jgi:hypothetical protein